jgi:hypothetical protein
MLSDEERLPMVRLATYTIRVPHWLHEMDWPVGSELELLMLEADGGDTKAGAWREPEYVFVPLLLRKQTA